MVVVNMSKPTPQWVRLREVSPNMPRKSLQTLLFLE